MKNVTITPIALRIVANMLDMFPGLEATSRRRIINGHDYSVIKFDGCNKTFLFCFNTDYWYRTLDAIKVE